MLWRIESTRNSLKRLAVLAVLAGLFAVLVPTGSAIAVNSGIGAEVCGDNVPPAEISISQPVSDSIVNQAITTFRGSIANATQVEISVDGSYSQTISIGASDSTFETSLTLSEGTHTVSMVANGICGTQNAQDSVVVTYQPNTEPSGGGTTPTDVPESGVSVDLAISKDDAPNQIQELPIVGSAVNIVSDFVDSIGLVNTIGTTTVAAGITRVGITVAALTTVVMASTLAPIAASAIPGISKAFSVTSHRSMSYLGWIIRGVGVLAMAFAYFL